MKFEQWSSVGVTELELECLTDQVTLVTELSEQILGFLWLYASGDSVQLNNPSRSNIFLIRKGEMGQEGRGTYLMVASKSSTVCIWNRLLSLLSSVPSATVGGPKTPVLVSQAPRSHVRARRSHRCSKLSRARKAEGVLINLIPCGVHRMSKHTTHTFICCIEQDDTLCMAPFENIQYHSKHN